MQPVQVMRIADASRTYGREAVRWAIKSGRWQQPRPRAVVLHNGPLVREDLLLVATLAGPAGTVLAGPTAAERWGLRGFEVPEVHVLIPHEARSFRGPVRHARLIRETLADAGGGVQSLPEHDFARLVRDHGLPQPTRQARVRGSRGNYYLDAEFEPWHVCVEVDGAHHRDPRQSEYDLGRQNELVVGGRVVLRSSSYQVRQQQPQVAAMILRGLRAAGWPG